MALQQRFARRVALLEGQDEQWRGSGARGQHHDRVARCRLVAVLVQHVDLEGHQVLAVLLLLVHDRAERRQHVVLTVDGAKLQAELTNLGLVAGFALLATSWRVLYAAQTTGTLATTGAYSYMRHPQYIGFIVIMFSFVLQWPTMLMFPFLVGMYVYLARTEEAEARREFGAAYDRYAATTPGWFPRIGGPPANRPLEGSG